MPSVRPFVGTVLALALVSAPMMAQQAVPPTPQSPPDTVQQLMMEYQSLQARLGTVQDSALQANPELGERQQELQEFVSDQMVEENPAIEGQIERLNAINAELQAAQAAGDTTGLQALVIEGRQIQQTVGQAQIEIVEREDVQARIESFEDRMVVAMKEIDPEVEGVLERMQTLATTIQRLQGGGA